MKPLKGLETAVPLLLICVAQLAMSLVYTNHMLLPLIHADEGGYLINALAIAGQTNGGSGLDYYAGFSLLLAPFALDGAASAYRAALIINSVFVAAMPLAYWIVLRRVFPALGTGRALLVVAFASFFPSHFVLAHLAFSDNLLIFAFGYAFVFFIMANERTGISRWLLAAIAGVLLGWCFLANPRGIVNGMALVTVACAFSFKHRSLKSTSLIMAAAWVGCIFVAHPLVEGLALKQATGDASGYSMSALLAKLLTPESLWKSLRNFIGVSTYVSIATLGLVFALLYPVKQAIGNLLSRDRSGGDAIPDVLLTATLASVVGSILLTALFFQEFIRVDHLFYGRYVVSSLAPCVLLGAGALLDGRTRLVSLAVGIVLSLVAIVFLSRAYQGIALPTGFAPFNVVEIYPFVSADGVFSWTQLVYALMVGAGLFLLLYVFRPMLALVFGLCLYVGMAFITSGFLWRQAAHDAPIANFVEDVNKVIASSRKPVCLRIAPGTDTWHVIHYRLYFSRNVGLDRKAGGGECVQAALVPASAATEYFRQGYRALAQDVREPNFLMVSERDLPLGTSLAAKGMDARLLGALPENGRRASLRVDALSPNSVAAGETARLWVTLKNESSQPWPRFNRSASALPGAVRLGVRFTSVDNPGRKIPELRGELPGALPAGEEAQVMLELPGTLSPGRYVMTVNLVNDGVAWFDCPSRSGCDYQLVVGPASLGNCVLGRGGCAFLMDAPASDSVTR